MEENWLKQIWFQQVFADLFNFLNLTNVNESKSRKKRENGFLFIVFFERAREKNM